MKKIKRQDSMKMNDENTNEQIQFLTKVLQSVADNEHHKDTYPLLQANLSLLNDGMIEIVGVWAYSTLVKLEQDGQISSNFSITPARLRDWVSGRTFCSDLPVEHFTAQYNNRQNLYPVCFYLLT
jgi:hypothetical protein